MSNTIFVNSKYTFFSVLLEQLIDKRKIEKRDKIKVAGKKLAPG